MAARYVIGNEKRKLLVVCAVLLTLAVATFAYWRMGSINGFIALTTLSAAVYALCIAISWYRPLIVLAFGGLLLDLLLVLDFTAPEPAVGSGSSATDIAVTTGAAVGNAIIATYAQIALLIVSFFLLLLVLTQRKWAPLIDGQ
jgi:hypothetical protein